MNRSKTDLLAYQLTRNVHPKILHHCQNIDKLFNFEKIQKNYQLTDKETEDLKEKVENQLRK